MGLVAEKGDRGLPGLRGRKGDLGIPGVRGMKGEPGPMPKLNMTALRGGKGDRGRRGKRGRPGIPGPPGPPRVPDYFDTAYSKLKHTKRKVIMDVIASYRRYFGS